MALLPGNLLEMSSHFMPLPRRSMIKASSSCDHLLCFLAGDSDACGGMLRFPGTTPVTDGPGSPRCEAAYTGDPRADTASMAVVAVGGGTDADRVCRGGDVEDSFESGALRREAISTVTVGGLESRLVFMEALAGAWGPRGSKGGSGSRFPPTQFVLLGSPPNSPRSVLWLFAPFRNEGSNRLSTRLDFRTKA